ncbi:AlpA family phage regulatory protein [Aestuariibacter halophilus]|uniref:AlpA family phage regulatory protein n=1 Tax=Fluctibacter halophilus TaxID=226011 RepID=A0ABS8G5T4_9ALTE|nr:AlpA family phage regulatory protein [Aestuariibacter halophilus]MCC2615920.1 AlpA family phage regulatory protein [Aestuariibacter halophilus]
MNYIDHPTINRKPEVIKRLGISRSTFHTRLNEQLLPPPISLGDRAVGFLQHEIDAVITAMAAGQSKTEIKALVAELVKRRKSSANALLSQLAA